MRRTLREIYSPNGYHLGRSYNYINLTVSFAEISTIQRHSVLVLCIKTVMYIRKRYLLSFSILLNKLPISAVMGQVLVADAVKQGRQPIYQPDCCTVHISVPHSTVTCTANITPLELAGTSNYTSCVCSLQFTTRQTILDSRYSSTKLRSMGILKYNW